MSIAHFGKPEITKDVLSSSALPQQPRISFRSQRASPEAADHLSSDPGHTVLVSLEFELAHLLISTMSTDRCLCTCLRQWEGSGSSTREGLN